MKKSKKITFILSITISFILLVIGISLAAFGLSQTGTNKELIVGDIWVKYEETNELILENAMPMDINKHTEYKVNPVMANQEVVDNELTRCVSIYTEMGIENVLDSVSTVESFCKGTGTVNGLTIQEDLESWLSWAESESTIEEGFLNAGGQELLDAEIIVKDGENYVVNPVMATQEVNELMRCVNYFTGYEFDEGSDAKSFCKGEGTLNELTIQEYLDEWISTAKSESTFEEGFLNDGGQELLDAGVIISQIENLPYFEFTISGKNTYTKKDIWYEIILNHGDEHEARTTRIRDDLLRFSLVEIKDGVETTVISNRKYNDLINKRIFADIIPKNTKEEIEITYRLYMWIDNDTVIGNVEEDYTLEEWNDVFASIKVNVNGDFVKKEDKTLAYSYRRALDENQNAVYRSPIGTFVSGLSSIYNNSFPIVDFNYVWYSGKMWRIVAIYPDNTMKLVTDKVATEITYGEDVHFYTNEEDNSYVYQWLNQEFLPTLYNHENIIEMNYKWDASPIEDKNDLPDRSIFVTSPVGLLNTYEYQKTTEYLYSYYQNHTYLNDNGGDNDFLINPKDDEYVWGVSPYSYALTYYNDGGIRPSIVLNSSVEKLSGDGTKTNPYRLKGDKAVTNEHLNERIIGEYVNFDNELYRIVDIENNITKLNKFDFIKNDDETNMEKKVSSSNSYGNANNIQSDEYWDYYLNNTWYNNISSKYKNMLIEGTYYLDEEEKNYKKNICKNPSVLISTKDCEKTTNIWVGYIGLPRYGEFINYKKGIRSNSYALISNSSSYELFAQPSITLSPNVIITSGSGMENDPFEIELSN